MQEQRLLVVVPTYIWIHEDAVKCRYDHGRKDSCCFRFRKCCTYTTEKAQQYGTQLVTLSDSNGWIYDPNGIDLDLVKAGQGSSPRKNQRVRRSKARR